jgi:hypothetical protein
MSKGLPRDPRREVAWRKWVGRQPGSGLSVREYCHQHGLKESAFYFWRAELARRGSRPAFVPVTVSAPGRVATGGGHLEIALAGGARIHVAGAVDRQLLADVLAVLEERSC